ncbi:MAG: radical SAM protein, partial [Selenomonadaceae bacterium]|nr:radical SAM protein [Selenomonadaceae bacterium]
MAWNLKAELRRQLEQEQGYVIYPAGGRERFALVYPNSYHVGMSNLGIHIIYELLNRRPDTACERLFLPEKKSLERYERTGTPLMSLETQTPLFRFPVIGFAVSFEMDYFHIMKILALGHVKLRAAERGEQEPLLIAGGPCATFNPEPLSLIFDAFIIGEGEAILPAFLDAYYAAKADGLPRRELLKRIAGVPGVYVPSLYEHCYGEDGTLQRISAAEGAPERITRQWVRDLDDYPAHTVIVTEHTEFDLYLIETARGCGRHCRFCMAGYCFRRPRNRSLSVIRQEVREALRYGKRIGLMGAAISDYPEIDALCKSILGEGLSMSVASFRADSVTKELVDSLAASGLKTLTMAPEAGSARMRAVINKGIEEKHLFTAVDLGLAAGIRNFRLYLMIGLPFEAREDIEAIASLADRLKDYMEEHGSRGTLTLSINPFVPKPFTPFQWLPMAEKHDVEAALKIIRAL